MPRPITSHVVNPVNDQISIAAVDQRGPGGANHTYEIDWPRKAEVHAEGAGSSYSPLTLHFQEGPIAENGINGVTQEALLAIVEDRLLSFQSGHYACRENEKALAHVQEAMMWLQRRTLERMRRGVEGTSKV